MSHIIFIGSTVILMEIGTDMSKWKNGKHFSAWVIWCPTPRLLVVKS